MFNKGIVIYRQDRFTGYNRTSKGKHHGEKVLISPSSGSSPSSKQHVYKTGTYYLVTVTPGLSFFINNLANKNALFKHINWQVYCPPYLKIELIPNCQMYFMSQPTLLTNTCAAVHRWLSQPRGPFSERPSPPLDFHPRAARPGTEWFPATGAQSSHQSCEPTRCTLPARTICGKRE